MTVQPKLTTWDDNMNDVRRYLFNDEILKDLMLLPEESRENIVDFRDKYFVLGETADEVLRDEDVRIVYYTSEPHEIENKVFKHYLEMDIYVRKNRLYDVDRDRLKRRDVAIFERIHYLLTCRKHICRMSFRLSSNFDASLKTIGYKRYHCAFSYYTTH